MRPTSIFDAYGHYEYNGLGQTMAGGPRGTQKPRAAYPVATYWTGRGIQGFGQAAAPSNCGTVQFPQPCAPAPTGQEPMLNCPDGQWGSPVLGIPCQAIPGVPQSSPPPATASPCPQGQMGFPPLLPCMQVPGQPTTAPPQMANPCGPNQVGWPPTIPCMTVVLPGPCPPGTVGVPPNCISVPAGPAQQPQPAPPPASTTPLPAPQPVPAPSQAAAVTTNWALPVAIGAGVLAVVLVVAAKKKKK